MAVATTALFSQRQRVIRRFKEAGATAPQRAIDPATHHIRQSLVFNQLVKEKVLIKADAHHFYLDEARATIYRDQGTSTIILILIVIAIAIALYFFVRWLM